MERIMPNFHRELQIPLVAISAIIGKNGRNFRSFRNSPGISSLHLNTQSRKLVIRGESEEAVHGVAWAIERRVCSIVEQVKEYGIDFFVHCFCKSVAQPLLAVDKISFENVSTETFQFDVRDAPRSYLCFKSGEACEEGSTFVRSVCDKIQFKSKSDLNRLCAEFSNTVGISESALYSYWDFSAYGNKLLSCLSSLRLQDGETSTRTVKLNILFGKQLLYVPPAPPNLCDQLGNGDFISLSQLQELYRRKSFNYVFCTAFSETAISDVRLQLERREYVKVSTRKKISIHVVDLEELLQPPRFFLSVRCDSNEGLCYNSEINRISRAKDYFQVLDVEREASDHEIERAYRRCLIRIHFDNAGAASENAIRVAEEAYVNLLDPATQDRFLQKAMGTSERPESPTSSEQKAVITRIRRRAKKHGHVTFYREGQATMDFRLGITSQEVDLNNISPEMVEWIEQAWRDRTPDQLLVFPPPERFLVVYMGYIDTETYGTEDWEFRISRAKERDRTGILQNERWECRLSSRWFKCDDGVKGSTTTDPTVNTHVAALVEEAAKFSELTFMNTMK